MINILIESIFDFYFLKNNMEKLIQQRNFVKREFRLSETKLFYSISKFGNSNEVDIPFENINGEKVSYNRSNNILLFVSMFFFIISIALFIGKVKGTEDIEHYAWLFWLIVGVIILGVYWFTKERFWKIRLTDENFIFVLKDKNNSVNANDFIDNLMNSRNQYLKESYAFVDENLSYENQLQNFRWLRSINVINKQEFEKLYSNLKKMVKPNNSNIGFSN